MEGPCHAFGCRSKSSIPGILELDSSSLRLRKPPSPRASQGTDGVALQSGGESTLSSGNSSQSGGSVAGGGGYTIALSPSGGRECPPEDEHTPRHRLSGPNSRARPSSALPRSPLKSVTTSPVSKSSLSTPPSPRQEARSSVSYGDDSSSSRPVSSGSSNAMSLTSTANRNFSPLAAGLQVTSPEVHLVTPEVPARILNVHSPISKLNSKLKVQLTELAYLLVGARSPLSLHPQSQ